MNRSGDLVYPELSYELMGIFFEIQNTLGSGLLEKHYQRAIQIALEDTGITFEKERLVRLEFNGKSIGRYLLDFVIEGKIVVEVKATRDFSEASFQQAYSYLRQINLPLAIVVNFHGEKLRYKRIVNPEFKDTILEEI